ncbi:hypothetical protein N8553_02605 [bacterium]|jgi:hypothetical protein|nr:hypothetical protein [bacterium]
MLLLGCLLVSSCSEEDPIRQYRVDKELNNKSAPSTAGNQFSADQQVWFFKLQTREELFEKFSNDFARMIIGADGSGAVPKYELPENWKATSGPAPVFQTIQVSENNDEAALTVTPLPAPASDPVGYLKGNLNRWRRQLGLGPLSSPEWLAEAMEASEVVSIPKGDQFITLVHIQGTTEKFGKTEMLVAMISDQSLTGTAAMATRPDAGTPPTPKPVSNVVKYDTPEGWLESEGNAMRLVSLAAKHESGIADVSVIRLPGGGDILPNINRWRGQVKLEPLEEDKLNESLETVEVDGMPGKLSLLEGPEESILAAIIEQDGVKWFFKMQGPTPAVKAEQEHFREFINSVELNLE